MTIPAIIARAAEAWHSTPAAIQGSRAVMHHVRARRLAVYVLREQMELSYPAIAAILCKDDSTVAKHYRGLHHTLIHDPAGAEARICRQIMSELAKETSNA